jgi:TRAP-type C4-dicarboxylate transport system permease small subunit
MLVYVGGALLVIMMLLSTGDVVGRYFFKRPIEGTYELIGLFLVLVLATGMANTQLEKAFVSVSIIYERLPRIAQLTLNIVAYIVGACIAVLLCWQVFELGLRYIFRTTGNLTETLHIPFAPFLLVLSLGFAFLALICLIDIYSAIIDQRSKKR